MKIRRISAFVITPIVVGVFASPVSVFMRGDLDKLGGAILLISGVAFGVTLVLVLPFYAWIRIKRRYCLLAILKTGAIAGGFTGACTASLLGSQFIVLGIVYGAVGGLVFHLIHGNMAITIRSNATPRGGAI